ncbi:MAG TPA: Asp-tRNA(Asn)/Glu-tRNA(Gln) amidotransferase subunit GatA [Anaerolineales bacterium]|jgi:aspartyl-tRNA(Asn)/glutamyl-tRNA(Gln) amidotransferase subunit A|nr:Asp-tRNA(Asn)/Glu-tRNA(Gln) amidotransferase subunit GatA [Anaerolineales bacterium]
MPDLTTLTLTEMQTGLNKGQFSSRELVQAALKRIESSDSKTHAFLHLAAEKALADADEADKQRKKVGAKHASPLLGIPIAIKDVLTVEGLPCTCGSKILEGYIPPFTATSVKRLKEAGAIIVGKTNTDEFAMGSSTEHSAYGVTKNPWDTTRVPGGSSGGSATAVAARYVPAALGTDTGGSVRQPASLCGITGLKTTYGRVSRYGLVAFGSSLDTVGAFGRTAEDVAQIFSVMAGRDPLDATSADQPVPQIKFDNNTVRGLKIGVPKEYFIKGIQPEVEEKTRAAIQQLKDLGAEIHEISLPHTEYALPVYYIIAPAEASANLARYDGIRYGPRVDADNLWDVYFKTRGSKFGPEVTRRVMIGTYALSAGYYDAYYGQAQKVRTLIKRDFETAFRDVDLIAGPTAPGTAFKIGEHINDPLAMYLEDVFTLPANLAGVPGVSVNCGFDKNNLPVGLQLIGPHFREDLLLRVAHAYQQVTDWHKQAPKL